MKNFKRMAKFGAVVTTAVILTTSSAHAALDLTGFSVNTADVETVMGVVIVGLAALWGYRKVIKTVNRS